MGKKCIQFFLEYLLQQWCCECCGEYERVVCFISDFLHVGYGGVCPVGHYCREGYTLPKPCPDGSYQDEEGKTYCKSCPAGFFCLAKASTFNDSVCPSGRYCPINTSVPYLCDEGTFNNLTGQEAESSCVSCTAGMYCEGNGLSKPTALCYGGWFCRNGSTNPTPDGGNVLSIKCNLLSLTWDGPAFHPEGVAKLPSS